MAPSSTARAPAMHFRSVDLPQPFPPTRPTTWPFITVAHPSLSRSVSATLSMTSRSTIAAPDASP